MKKFACRYAIIQFVPFSETEEFANVGIVLTCPETGYFDFKLQVRRYGRVTAFFEEINADVYRTSIKAIQAELERIQQLVHKLPQSSERADVVRQLLVGLTHPREAMVRFGAVRPVLANEPSAELNQLFEHYVERAFATPEYVEQTITKRIQTLFDGLVLPAPFKADAIGDEQFHVRFPFVQRRDDEIAKVIKPFNLAQAEANSIFEHGDTWLQKMRRLHKRNLLPQNVLFAVAAPPLADEKRFSAYEEICGELRLTGVQLVNSQEEPRIVQFALGV